MSVPMKPDDPAYWMLLDDYTTTPIPDIYRADCYICRDPEFAQMGLPLCYRCPACKGHVPADDTECTDCGANAQAIFEQHPELRQQPVIDGEVVGQRHAALETAVVDLLQGMAQRRREDADGPGV